MEARAGEALNIGVTDVRHLGRGMVAPDNCVFDLVERHLEASGNLADCTVLVEAGEGCEVLLWDGRSIFGHDEGVGVCGVADHQNADCFLGNTVKNFALRLENLGIASEQIFTLHAWATWLGADHHTHVSIFESHFGISRSHDFLHQREGSVNKFHLHAFQSFSHGWQFKKMKNNALRGPQHAALGNHERQDITDLASSTCNDHTHRFRFAWLAEEVATQLLQALNALAADAHLRRIHSRYNYKFRILKPTSLPAILQRIILLISNYCILFKAFIIEK